MKNQITKSEIKEIRKAIKDFEASLPDGQISFGEYIGTVGYKYVEVINCHNNVTSEKIPLEEFSGMVSDGYQMTFGECYADYRERNLY